MTVHRRRKKRRLLWVLLAGALVLLCALGGFEYYRSTYGLQVTELTWDSPKVQSPVRLCLLTDLHDREFGPGNERLITAVAEQRPDLILVTGDIVDKSRETTDIAKVFLKGLVDIAPVYVSIGNHEIYYQENYGRDLTGLYEACGATVLEYGSEDVDIRGEKLRLGGLYGYCLSYKFGQESDEEECAYLKDFQDTDRETILLCHMPVCWHKSIDDFQVDLVVSGHVHGGQMILPGIGGVYAPDYGWFPGRLTGIFASKDQQRALIISAGLGSTEKVPRINNVPDVTMVTVN